MKKTFEKIVTILLALLAFVVIVILLVGMDIPGKTGVVSEEMIEQRADMLCHYARRSPQSLIWSVKGDCGKYSAAENKDPYCNDGKWPCNDVRNTVVYSSPGPGETGSLECEVPGVDSGECIISKMTYSQKVYNGCGKEGAFDLFPDPVLGFADYYVLEDDLLPAGHTIYKDLINCSEGESGNLIFDFCVGGTQWSVCHYEGENAPIMDDNPPIFNSGDGIFLQIGFTVAEKDGTGSYRECSGEMCHKNSNEFHHHKADDKAYYCCPDGFVWYRKSTIEKKPVWTTLGNEKKDIISNAEGACCSNSDCTNLASWVVNRYIFITSSTYNGNMGGIEGADAECQALASAAGLEGTYVALLSNSTHDAKDRTTICNLKNTKGDPISSDCSDLWDGDIKNAVQYDENGNTVNHEYIWTGSDENGIGIGDYCYDWTSDRDGWNTGDPEDFGHCGESSSNVFNWMSILSQPCSDNYRIYCVSA